MSITKIKTIKTVLRNFKIPYFIKLILLLEVKLFTCSFSSSSSSRTDPLLLDPPVHDTFTLSKTSFSWSDWRAAG